MKKIYFVDTDDLVKRKLEMAFDRHNLNDKYKLEIIQPEKDEYNNHSILEERLSNLILTEGNIIEGIFIDIALFEEGKSDISGVLLASTLKKNYRDILIFLYTNYYVHDDLYRFAEATLYNLDGVFPKNYFTEKFSVDKLTSLFGVAKSKYAPNTSKSDNKISIGVIVALNDPEFTALKTHFPMLRKVNMNSDTTVYYQCKDNYNESEFNLIAATDDTMGMSAASTLTTKMQILFNLDCIVILGICAGMKNKTNIGDIIIPEMTWDYGKGKVTTDKTSGELRFIPYPDQIKTDNILFKKIKTYLNDNSNLLNNIKDINRKYFVNSHEVKCHFKPFASGAAVIANSKNVDEISLQHGKLIGFDMESYGVYYAAANITEKRVIPLSIKSVSDFGDEEKNNSLKSQHQIYAANNSVLLFKNILDTILIPFLITQVNLLNKQNVPPTFKTIPAGRQ